MFTRKADVDGLASFVKHIDKLVTENLKKKAKGTVIVLADKKDEVAPALEKLAKDEKIEHVPLTVAVDGSAGPDAYSIAKDAVVTVVVYDNNKKITATFGFDKLDAKSQSEALAAFAKVLGVEAPKVDEKK